MIPLLDSLPFSNWWCKAIKELTNNLGKDSTPSSSLLLGSYGSIAMIVCSLFSNGTPVDMVVRTVIGEVSVWCAARARDVRNLVLGLV